MEWSTKPTTMDVRSASANLTVSESLSANRIVSVCKPDGESQCVCNPHGESQCVCKPYGESLSVCKTRLSVCLSVSNLKVRVSLSANLLVSVCLQTFWCQSVSNPDGESQSAKLMVSVCLSANLMVSVCLQILR